MATAKANRTTRHGGPIAELVLTILSQNTSDANSGRAFMRLRSRFPEWESLMAADPSQIESEIREGGLSRIKAPRIVAALAEVWRRQGSLGMSFLRGGPPPGGEQGLGRPARGRAP